MRANGDGNGEVAATRTGSESQVRRAVLETPPARHEHRKEQDAPPSGPAAERERKNRPNGRRRRKSGNHASSEQAEAASATTPRSGYHNNELVAAFQKTPGSEGQRDERANVVGLTTARTQRPTQPPRTARSDFHGATPAQRSPHFSWEDDVDITRLREEEGLSFPEILKRYPGSSRQALRARYQRMKGLDSSSSPVTPQTGAVKFSRFTSDEDAELVRLRAEGLTFAAIAERVPGRSEYAISNRYRRLKEKDNDASRGPNAPRKGENGRADSSPGDTPREVQEGYERLGSVSSEESRLAEHNAA